MTVTRFVIFTVLTLVIAGILYVIQIPVRRMKKPLVRCVLWVLKALLMAWLAYVLIALASPFLWRFDYALTALYLALLGDLTAELIYVLIRRKKVLPILISLCTLAHLGYSMWNMGTIRPVYHTYQSEKLKEPCRIVFLSDLHYGSSQTPETVSAALAKIREEQPDVLILGGDITDEHTTNEEMHSIFEEISALGIPTYYIYGNHDRQDRASYLDGPAFSEAELQETIEGCGITVLYNESVSLRDDLYMYGSEDPSRPEQFRSPDTLSPFPEDPFTVYLVHTPPQLKEPVPETDLVLSGHTHAGQFFPVRLMYLASGMHCVWEYPVNDTVLLVSPGIAGWYLPVRNESICSYEVIDLLPQ
ncbi:MAG: metallophosphoesterase [Solobacterium sp.]|nr:metallophosphoesterase [Solobacterium sp.]